MIMYTFQWPADEIKSYEEAFPFINKQISFDIDYSNPKSRRTYLVKVYRRQPNEPSQKENKDIVTSADHRGRSMITYIQNTNKENKIVTPVTFHIIQEQ